MSNNDQNRLLAMRLEFDSIKNEYQICEQKLTSKCEALRIMTKTLDQTRQQRDQFKLMAEQNLTELNYNFIDELPKTSDYSRNISFMDDAHKVMLVGELMQRNKALQFSVTDLQQKLNDARGDIKLLRERKQRESMSSDGSSSDVISSNAFTQAERESLVEKLELSTERCRTLERDLEGLLDEKEERETDKDGLRQKFEQINEQLNYVLNGDDNRIVDINALTMDNRYLHDRLENLEKEKSMALSNVSRYKGLLDRHKPHGILKNGEIRPKSTSSGIIVTPKQVNEILKNHGNNSLSKSSDLHTLAEALLDSLNDKSMLLSHQRKANRILASRVSDLEKKLQSLDGTNSMDSKKSELLNKLCKECHDITDSLHQDSSPDLNEKVFRFNETPEYIKDENSGETTDKEDLHTKQIIKVEENK